jgi:glycosyltransferase involved in cell wall biosynthesis
MKSPLFSDGFAVLMALYYKDDPILFSKAVRSIFDNTIKPNEVVIVVDGPIGMNLESEIAQLVSEFKTIQIIRLAKNQGLANALNIGLKEIKQPWVVRADADDLNLPHRFETLANLVSQSPELTLVGSAILEVEKNGNPLMIRVLPESDAQIRQFAKRRNPFNHMSVAYQRQCILDVGGYPEVFLKEDYALWCRLLKSRYPVANTKEILVHATAGEDLYRRRGGWKYAKSEWDLQKTLVECHLKGRISAIVDGLSRSIVFLAPPSFRAFIYKTFLRKK